MKAKIIPIIIVGIRLINNTICGTVKDIPGFQNLLLMKKVVVLNILENLVFGISEATLQSKAKDMLFATARSAKHIRQQYKY